MTLMNYTLRHMYYSESCVRREMCLLMRYKRGIFCNAILRGRRTIGELVAGDRGFDEGRNFYFVE